MHNCQKDLRSYSLLLSRHATFNGFKINSPDLQLGLQSVVIIKYTTPILEKYKASIQFSRIIWRCRRANIKRCQMVWQQLFPGRYQPITPKLESALGSSGQMSPTEKTLIDIHMRLILNHAFLKDLHRSDCLALPTCSR